jgi:hypothetical protein
MALQNNDLFVVNRAGTSYKLDYQSLAAALAYTLPTASGTVLGGIKVGTHLSIDANGVLSANLPGALVYKGTIAANAAAPTAPASGDVWILSSAGTITGASWGPFAGTSVNTGDMLIYAGTKWDHVGSSGGGGAAGVTGVDVTAPVTKAGTAAQPLIGVSAASTTAAGVVQLADAAAITAGTTGRVVDAAQLAAAAVVYASSAETLAGTITNKAVTPAAGKATYLPLNFTTLTALP